MCRVHAVSQCVHRSGCHGLSFAYLTLLSCLDDSASAASSMEVSDRIASLEQRVQMQEDDIQLLKSALADVVRRLNITEEQQAVLNRKGPTKGGHGVVPIAALNIWQFTPKLTPNQSALSPTH